MHRIKGKNVDVSWENKVDRVKEIGVFTRTNINILIVYLLIFNIKFTEKEMGTVIVTTGDSDAVCHVTL